MLNPARDHKLGRMLTEPGFPGKIGDNVSLTPTKTSPNLVPEPQRQTEITLSRFRMK